MKNKFKKLGIIGGMGPLADDTFLSLLHSYGKSSSDNRYIPFILDGNCTRPDRSSFLCGLSKESPFDSLVHSAKTLIHAGCDCLVMPCNTAHFWYPELVRMLPEDVDFPSMPQLTLQAVVKSGAQKVLLLSTTGTLVSGVYHNICDNSEYTLIEVPDDISELTEKVIATVKSGEYSNISGLLSRATEYGADAVILGCTELSRALHLEAHALPKALHVIDSLSVLVRYTLEAYYGKDFIMPHSF